MVVNYSVQFFGNTNFLVEGDGCGGGGGGSGQWWEGKVGGSSSIHLSATVMGMPLVALHFTF